MNRFALEQLDLKDNQHILEIGCGGGDLIYQCLHTKIPVYIVAIDPMLAAIEIVQKRFQSAIASGQLSLKQASAEQMPFPERSFEAIATVNTVYFWSDVAKILRECHRVLKPNGKMLILYNDKALLENARFTQYGFRAYEPEEMEKYFQEAAFVDVKTTLSENPACDRFFCTQGVVRQ